MDRLQKIQEAKSDLKFQIESSIKSFIRDTEGEKVFLDSINISLHNICEIGVGQVSTGYRVEISIKI